MRWPWSRPPVDRDGAAARQDATAGLHAAQARWAEVHRVSRSLRELRERNGFAESVSTLFRGDPR